MRNLLLIVALFLAFQVQAKVRKALYVIMDGVEPHFLEYVHPQTIFDIAKTGSYAHAYCGGEVGKPNQTVTISAVGYTNILTGTWMNKHHVLGNSNIETNYNYWNIFRIAKAQKRPLKTAVFTSWTDNVTYLVGVNRADNGNLKVDEIVDSLDLDNTLFPHQPLDRQIYDIDSTVCDRAASCIRDKAPDLSWVYLWYTDDAFHNKGFGDYSKTYLLKEDEQLKKIWEAIKYREKVYDEEWMLIVTTDHGREQRGYSHGGQSETERNIWISTNIKNVNEHFHSADLSQVDINPTLCRWLSMDVPQDVLWEQEGMPFIGKVDIDHLRSYQYDHHVVLTWKPLTHQGDADIYMATTNNFKNGKADKWIKMGSAPVKNGKFVIDLPDQLSSKFLKFVVETPNNHLSRWFYLK